MRGREGGERGPNTLQSSLACTRPWSSHRAWRSSACWSWCSRPFTRWSRNEMTSRSASACPQKQGKQEARGAQRAPTHAWAAVDREAGKLVWKSHSRPHLHLPAFLCSLQLAVGLLQPLRFLHKEVSDLAAAKLEEGGVTKGQHTMVLVA
jgi:hypothetical protein